MPGPPTAPGAPPYAGSPFAPPAAWPSPVHVGAADELTIKAAAQEPQNVFLAELLGTGIFCLPGIGHLMVGEMGLGIALLIGYPLVIGAFWTCIVLFTCGIGSLLVPLQIPINFLVGYLLGERMKARVLDAKARLGR